MSDDLVKRLRDWEHVWPQDLDGPEGGLYLKAAVRIEELEAKLAKAVEALKTIAKPKVGPDFDWTEDEVNKWRAVWYRKYADTACTTLAELTGGKDE